MRGNYSQQFNNDQLITLKDQEWLANHRVAGQVAFGALSLLKQEVKSGTTKTLIELDKLAEIYIRDHQCLPTFLGYKGFPNTCCLSVNKRLVHGIPTNYRLESGDIFKIDLGVTWNKTIGDCATTLIYGEPKSPRHLELVQATEEALNDAVKVIQVGKRLGVIGQAISQCARRHNLGVIVNYGGHGIDFNTPHAPPFVANKSSEYEGITIQPGLVIAVEPLLILGSSTRTRTMEDGWSVEADDFCSHHEHTLFVHQDHVEIITERKEL